MDTKICTKCKKEQSLLEFSFKNKSIKTRRADCKTCNRKIILKHYQANKEDYKKSKSNRRQILRQNVCEYLSDKFCIDCKNNDSRVLEFDHVRGVKVANISTMIRNCMTWDVILTEISKCDVRCANCHRIRTAIQQGWIK